MTRLSLKYISTYTFLR